MNVCRLIHRPDATHTLSQDALPCFHTLQLLRDRHEVGLELGHMTSDVENLERQATHV